MSLAFLDAYVRWQFLALLNLLQVPEVTAALYLPLPGIFPHWGSGSSLYLPLWLLMLNCISLGGSTPFLHVALHVYLDYSTHDTAGSIMNLYVWLWARLNLCLSTFLSWHMIGSWRTTSESKHSPVGIFYAVKKILPHNHPSSVFSYAG
jgi:hypothetical protein